MKKTRIYILVIMLCLVSNMAFANFELNKIHWLSLGANNSFSVYYHTDSIEVQGDTATVWLCQHRISNDSYRVMQKQYKKGNNTSTQLKILNYYSDGTFKSGNSRVIENMPISNMEQILLARLWK